MPRVRHRPRPIIFGLLAVVVAVAAWYAVVRTAPPPAPETPPDEWDDVAPDPPPPDPRLTFPTPFRNVRPDIVYVGDAACAGCHADICTSYHAHPMGRSAEIVGRPPPGEKDDATAGKTFSIGAYNLRVGRTADRVVHHLSGKDATGDPPQEYTLRTDLVIGSGTRGRSYLWTENGAVWQSPVGWFTDEGRWKLFPGFHHQTGGAWPAHTDCLFCHVDRVEQVRHSLNRYREPLLPIQAAIGCERCHGPGGLHAAERAARPPDDRIDTTIVNPKHLPPELRTGVCAQCHLQGQERVVRRGRELFEFRPGLPFEQFVTVLVRPPDLAGSFRSGGQFEQVEQSRCADASGNRIGCTSCHDPHSTPAPAARDGFYRGRCLSCHASKGCTAPPPDRARKADSCVACHMPRAAGSPVTHVSVTDHRILRRPAEPRPGRRLLPGEVPLVAFRTGIHAPQPEERERDLGVGLARLTPKIPNTAPAAAEGVAALAVDRLTASLARWKGDSDAWVALASVRGVRREAEARLAAAAYAVRLTPDSETALAEAAEADLAAGRFDQAIDAATRLAGMNPSAPQYRMTRAIALVRKGAWADAEMELRAVLGANPLHSEARVFTAVCRNRLGDTAGARRELDAALGLIPDPRQREAQFERFRRETR